MLTDKMATATRRKQRQQSTIRAYDYDLWLVLLLGLHFAYFSHARSVNLKFLSSISSERSSSTSPAWWRWRPNETNEPTDSTSTSTSSDTSPTELSSSSSSATTTLLTPLTDFGKLCSADSECESGLCSTSCSAFDFASTNSTSCICPSNNGPDVCCGCSQNGYHEITTCPSITGWAGTASAPPDTYPPFPPSAARYAARNPDYLYVVDPIPDTPSTARYTVPFEGRSAEGTKIYGEPCETAVECSSGICGTGCSCTSDLVGMPCSCECLCNFPSKCCGGCFLGSDPKVQDCPTLAGAVDYETFDGPTPYSWWRSLGYRSRWGFLRDFGYASSSGGSSYTAEASLKAASISSADSENSLSSSTSNSI